MTDGFAETYGRAPDGVWRAPGRVNLIGEHTDYNDGFVLPFALSRGVSVAAARRDDGVIEVRSRQASTVVTAPVDGPPVVSEGWPSEHAWAAYPVGVARVLQEHGTGGASLLIDSDLPQEPGCRRRPRWNALLRWRSAICTASRSTVPRWHGWRSVRRTSRSGCPAG